jgi:uncharacterized membrane protein
MYLCVYRMVVLFICKKWWQSKTIWGTIVAFVGTVVGIFGGDITAAESDTLTQAAGGLVAGIGAVFAIIGRMKADKTINS